MISIKFKVLNFWLNCADTHVNTIQGGLHPKTWKSKKNSNKTIVLKSYTILLKLYCKTLYFTFCRLYFSNCPIWNMFTQEKMYTKLEGYDVKATYLNTHGSLWKKSIIGYDIICSAFWMYKAPNVSLILSKQYYKMKFYPHISSGELGLKASLPQAMDSSFPPCPKKPLG